MARAARAKVYVKEWEHFTRAWKRFEKAVDAADVIQDYRDHEFYEKPSSKKKREKSFAVSREKKRRNEERSVNRYND